MKGKASRPLYVPEPHCYGVLIIRPVGTFRRKSGAIPKKWTEDHWRLSETRQSYCIKDAAKYNRAAIRRGWSTWAIVLKDAEIAKFLKDGERAGLRLPGKERSGLEIHAFAFRNPRRLPTPYFGLFVELAGGGIDVDYTKGVDLRALAIKRIEEVLAKVKAAAAKASRSKGGGRNA